MLLSNYHTHTCFCDGAEMPEKYAEEAIRQNFDILGYSAHATLPFQTRWTVPDGKLTDYHDTIQKVKNINRDKLEIYCGLEMDYIPVLWDKIKANAGVRQWDYIIGSIHFVDAFTDGSQWTIDGNNEEFKKGFAEVFQNDSHALIRKYFALTREMVQEMKPDIIGHIDKIKMQHTPGCFVPDTDPIFRQEFANTLDEIAASNCIVEINTRGVYRRNEPEFYPSGWAIREMFRRKIPVTISSDAHKPEDISQMYLNALKLIRKEGYREVKVLHNGAWMNQSI